MPLVANSPVEGGDVIIDDGVSIVDTWKGIYCLFIASISPILITLSSTAMTQLPKSKVRSVGVSNHQIEHVRTPRLPSNWLI